MATLLLLLIAAGLFAWGASLQSKMRRLRHQLAPVASAEHYAETARRVADSRLAKAEEEAKQIIDSANKQAESELTSAREKALTTIGDAREESRQLRSKIDSLRADAKSAKDELELLTEALRLKEGDAHLLEVGYYEPIYEFEDILRYEVRLNQIREQQRAMLREDGTGKQNAAAAAYATKQLTFNGSASQGRAAQKKTMNLMLRAFNGESDSFIARVNYRNVKTMEKRIRSAFETINSITAKYDFCTLNTLYLDLRLQELHLVYEWEEAKQREKEEQAQIREQIREEEKAKREAERAQQQAEKEEAKYKELLRKAEQEVLLASQHDKARLNAQIKDLQKRIDEIEEKKRSISQAMLTKTGHVYIISNVGSFGENVYKIGMTRRLEPIERVRELGDASVPFPFDVHALIRTSDAPALENALHKHFGKRRLNLENERKEFFRISIDEIQEELDLLKESLNIDSELRLTLLAEAKQYRISEAKRRHLEASQLGA